MHEKLKRTKKEKARACTMQKRTKKEKARAAAHAPSGAHPQKRALLQQCVMGVSVSV